MLRVVKTCMYIDFFFRTAVDNYVHIPNKTRSRNQNNKTLKVNAKPVARLTLL